MEVTYENGNAVLKKPDSFNISHIFDCGQCFRFNKTDDNAYIGTAFGKTLKISENDGDVILYCTSREDFENIWYDFFDLDTDYAQIKRTLSSDEVMEKAVKCGDGIRILKQDLWESVVSFIISQSNNIPRIKGIIERLCENFGDKISYMGNTYYSFPSYETLSKLSLEDLSVIRAGFRDKYILNAAKMFASEELSEKELRALSAQDAKNALMQVKGIGNKVSDCILLFGLSHTEAFPIDVWIKRITEYCWFESEQPVKTIGDFAKKKFGALGGYAQQYLFFYARENKIGV